MPPLFPSRKSVPNTENTEGRFDREGMLRPGYSQREPLEDLIEFFALKPEAEIGKYKGTGVAVNYSLLRLPVRVTVTSLDATMMGLLVLSIVITTVVKGDKVLLFQGDLICLIDSHFPFHKPKFHARKKEGRVKEIYQPISDATHNVPTMCLFNGPNDWQPNTDTIISGINVAFEQIVQGYKP